MKAFYDQFSEIIRNFLSQHQVEVSPPFWEIPRDKKNGDLTTMVALKLASRFKQKPYEIAERIKDVLEEENLSYIEEIKVIKPGFVNLYFSDSALIDFLQKTLSEKENAFRDQRGRRVLLEFVSANPTGPLSIAHGRQAVVGDTISRLLTFLGDKVTTEYYLNDHGNQINLLVESVKAKIDHINGNQNAVVPEGGYHGDYIKDVAYKLKDTPMSDLAQTVVATLTDLIKQDLSRLDVKFSSWFSQDNLIKDGKVGRAIDALKEKGHIYQKDGAQWFSASAFGDDKDRVLEKSDKQLTYFASDVAYHKNKLERNFDQLINLWGPDHHGYIQRVKAAVAALGFDEKLLKILIIQIVKVKTKKRMSRRQGTAILLSDLLDEVGKDAARFYYLLRKNSSPLEFDIDLAKSASFENPLYYIQYAHARIKSIFRKAQQQEVGILREKLDINEKKLLRDLVQFNYWLDKVYFNLEPVFLIEYLKTIASSFHKFYETTPVLTKDKEKTALRLAILTAVATIIDCGLSILGIKPLERM
jgi:arginyl-tRNA synthetase